MPTRFEQIIRISSWKVCTVCSFARTKIRNIIVSRISIYARYKLLCYIIIIKYLPIRDSAFPLLGSGLILTFDYHKTSLFWIHLVARSQLNAVLFEIISGRLLRHSPLQCDYDFCPLQLLSLLLLSH